MGGTSMSRTTSNTIELNGVQLSKKFLGHLECLQEEDNAVLLSFIDLVEEHIDELVDDYSAAQERTDKEKLFAVSSLRHMVKVLSSLKTT